MDAPSQSIFGQITIEDMRKNGLLTKTVLPLIKKAVDKGDGGHTVESVVDGLISGRYLLWGAMKPPATLQAVAVTMVDDRAYKVLMLGGPSFDDVRAFFQFLPRLAHQARAAKCVRMLIVGGLNWRDCLPDGWRPVATIYEHRLAPEA